MRALRCTRKSCLFQAITSYADGKMTRVITPKDSSKKIQTVVRENVNGQLVQVRIIFSYMDIAVVNCDIPCFTRPFFVIHYFQVHFAYCGYVLDTMINSTTIIVKGSVFIYDLNNSFVLERKKVRTQPSSIISPNCT